VAKKLKSWSAVKKAAAERGYTPEQMERMAKRYQDHARKLKDPAMMMSLPSKDPENVLGYYQWVDQPVANPESEYSSVLQEPITRAGFKPKYDVFPEAKYDPLAMGEKTTYWGGTLPAGYRWSEMPENRGTPVSSMKRQLREGRLDEADRSELKYSDQTAYLNPAVRTQDRPGTVAHEGTHRAIWTLAEKAGMEMDMDTNKLLTRSLDYKYGDKKTRERSKGWLKRMSPDGTIEGALKKADPLIEKLQKVAYETRKRTD